MSRFVEAESAIRQLHARYIDAVWRQDPEAYGDCWAEDAHWKYMGPADLSKRFLPIPDYGKPPWHPDPERAAAPPASSIF